MEYLNHRMENEVKMNDTDIVQAPTEKLHLSPERLDGNSTIALKEHLLLDDSAQGGYMSDFFASPYSERSRMGRKGQSSKDEFWDALSSNYDYLMDDGLIATCREASSDLSLEDDEDLARGNWSFTYFIEQFKRLHDTLHQLQVKMDDCENEGIIEEQKKVALLCKLFNEQGQKLSEKYPEMRDEVLRHLNLLNNKWEAVEHSINPNKTQVAKDHAFNEITIQMRCLRRCLRELESRLLPVTSSSKWSLEKIEENLKKQMVLQKEIEAKGKYVSALLKLCESLEGNISFGQQSVLTWDAERVQKVASNLQHRWHSIWLQSLECQCILEEQKLKLEAVQSSENKLEQSFSEEPVKKYPRLSDKCNTPVFVKKNDFPIDMNSKSDEDVFATDPLVRKTNKLLQSFRKGSTSNSLAAAECKNITNDKGIMVGNTGIAELKAKCNGDIGKFEIVQDVGYSSETSAHFSNDELIDTSNINFQNYELTDVPVAIAKTDNNCIAHVKVQKSSLPNFHIDSPNKFILSPDKYPSVDLRKYISISQDLAIGNYEFNKVLPGTFYQMIALDTDDCDGSADNTQISSISNFQDTVLPQEQASLVAAPKYNLSTDVPDSSKHSSVVANSLTSPSTTLKRGRHLHKSLSLSDTPKGSLIVGGKSKGSARVREWLDNCHSDHEESNLRCKIGTDSSCDASGECTTTESDGEKSAASDDVNNSLSFSQSYTGSVETVVPVLKEETIVQNDPAGTTEPSPSVVRMRKKKKHVRDRPWSVTELHQGSFPTGVFTHSTSEGAINTLRNSGKRVSCSKKLCLDRGNSSLTDVSVTSCPVVAAVKPSSPQNTNRISASGSESAPSPKKFSGSEGEKHSDSIGDTTLVPGKDGCIFVFNPSDHPSHSSSSNSTKRRSQSRHKRHSKTESLRQRNRSVGSADKKGINIVEGPKLSSTNNSNPSCTEDQSSVSDQVWDEYQDPPYLSEPYSEQTADEDQVSKLLSFGDDYRTMLGSLSDDTSSANTKEISCRPQGKSRSRSIQEGSSSLYNSGSDSDTEDFNDILATSYRALQFAINCVNENSAEDSIKFSSEFADLIATCQTNLCHLLIIRDQLVAASDCQSFSPSDLSRLQELIREWEELHTKIINLPRRDSESKLPPDSIQASIKEVQNVVMDLKSKLMAILSNASDALSAITDIKQLEQNIQILQTGLATLQEMKGAVLSVNAMIFRLISESKNDTVLSLRDDAVKLYQQWEDVYELSSSQLTRLQSLRPQFQEISSISPAINEKKENNIANDSFFGRIVENVSKSNSSILLKPQNDDDEIDELVPLYPKGFEFSSDKSEDLDKEDETVLSHPMKNNRSLLRRAFMAAMPIQFLLVIAYCFSCLVQPKCCENMNNFEFSIFPQLRHFQGPPPV